MNGRNHPTAPRPLVVAAAAAVFMAGVVLVLEALTDGFTPGYAGVILIAAAGLFLLRETRPRSPRR